MANQRPSRQAGRRRHRHRRRHLARRRQEGQLGSPDLGALRHPPDHALSGRSPEHPHRRHRRFPWLERQGGCSPHLRTGRNCGARGARRGGLHQRRFRRPAVPCLAAGRAGLERPLLALQFRRRNRKAISALLTVGRSLKTQDIFETTQFGSIADRLADRFGTRGLPVTLSTACASGATAIQLGVEAIRRGECERALADRRRRFGDRRGADPLFAAVGAVDQQRHPRKGLQAILQGPRRLRPGRRFGGAGAGIAGKRGGARRERFSASCAAAAKRPTISTAPAPSRTARRRSRR